MNRKVSIIWKQHPCKHSGNCEGGLQAAFQNRGHARFKPKGASVDAIMVQADKCPRGPSLMRSTQM